MLPDERQRERHVMNFIGIADAPRKVVDVALSSLRPTGTQDLSQSNFCPAAFFNCSKQTSITSWVCLLKVSGLRPLVVHIIDSAEPARASNAIVSKLPHFG